VPRRPLVLLAAAGLALASHARGEPREARTAVASTPALERDVFELVNRRRRTQGLRPLALDEQVSRQARRHSQAMAAGTRRLGHRGFDDRVAALRRVTACDRAGENVALGRGRAVVAVRSWVDSPGHRRNIDGRYDSTGVGVARTRAGEVYITQIFCGR
jgi:uncharacterized protein YkwD